MARKRRKTSRKTVSSRKRGRRTSGRKKTNGRMVNFFVPLFLIFCILFCMGLLLMMGYRNVTASSFFDLQAVAIRGVSRTSPADIERIVKRRTIETGVWNADTDQIKREVEDLKFVKSASVSRVLPNKFRVIVKERVPRAVVRISGKDFWVDDDALILSTVSPNDNRPNFTMFGWDTRKTAVAVENNIKRVELFSELRKEWRKFDLASRVKAIDLSDLTDPRAIVADSGENVTIYLGQNDFRRALQIGLENVAGRGKEVESIIVDGIRPVVEFRDS